MRHIFILLATLGVLATLLKGSTTAAVGPESSGDRQGRVLLVETNDKRQLEYTFSPGETVSTLRYTIAVQNGYTEDEVTLNTRNGEIMVDGKTLEDYDIHDGSSVFAFMS